jgi:hypothetical protein
MSDELTRERFNPYLDQAFRITSPEIEEPFAPIDLVLVEVADLSDRYDFPDEFRDPFSLLFRGPQSPALPQTTYGLRASDGYETALFLVPVGLDEKGHLYEAVVA